ncbi:putative LOG family protein [Helianthus anomalus]
MILKQENDNSWIENVAIKEAIHSGEVKEVVDMHLRKAKMGKHYDAFIALPVFF